MKSFTHTYKNVLLFAEETFGGEGWIAAIYNLEKHEMIDKGGWIHSDPESAKRDAIRKAESFLRHPLPVFQWEEGGGLHEEKLSHVGEG